MISNGQSTKSRALRSIALVTLVLLFSLTFFGQSAMAAYPWAEDPPKQNNKPPGMDDHPWGSEHRQLNKPNTDTDDHPWGSEQKQLNKPDLNTPDPGFADLLLLWLLN